MVQNAEAFTNNAMRLDSAASTLIFHILRRCCDLTTSVPKTYGTTIRLAILGYWLEQQAFGGGASWKMVSLIAAPFSRLRKYLHQDLSYNRRHDGAYWLVYVRPLYM
jgi:hypothetical protein